jgi:transketolase
MSPAKELRLRILELYHSAGAGHIACSLSCIDLLYAVFSAIQQNDRILLSKGHAAVALYACLEYFGELKTEQLDTFYKDGTNLSAHPSPWLSESAPFATGSLGHGFPVAAGIALAKKRSIPTARVFVLMSDGETNEGTTWEAAHFARTHKLSNLIVLIDKNGIQGFDRSEKVLGDTSAKDQWESLGFNVMETDGHCPTQLSQTLELAKKMENDRPTVILARTVKGKGVSFMENTVDWHYWPMNEDQYRCAVSEIKLMSEISAKS